MDQIAKVKVTKEANDSEDCKEFGRRLQESLDKAGKSQADVSRFLEVSRSAVNWWIQGHTYPSIQNAKKLASMLRTTPEYLLFGAVHVQKERLVDSIRIMDGKTETMNRLAIPREFMVRAQLPRADKLIGITVLSNKPLEGVDAGDIIIIDTSDRIPLPKAGVFVLDNGEVTDIASVKKTPSATKMHVTMHGETFDMPYDDKLVVGRVVAQLRATA